MTITEFRNLVKDHDPESYLTIKMKDISWLLDYVESLELKPFEKPRKSYGYIALAEEDIKYKYTSLEKAKKYTVGRTDKPIIVELVAAE
jgi:hypothetical protein